MEHVEKVLDLKAVEAQMSSTHTTLEAFITKANEEAKLAGTASAETKAAIDKLAEKSIKLGDKIADLEQKQATHFEGEPEQKTAGEMLLECDEFKTFMERGKRGSAQIEVKTAIVNAAPSLTQPLTAGHRLDRVIKEPDRALRIRDILPVGQTTSNIVWFPKENTLNMPLSLAA